MQQGGKTVNNSCLNLTVFLYIFTFYNTATIHDRTLIFNHTTDGNLHCAKYGVFTATYCTFMNMHCPI